MKKRLLFISSIFPNPSEPNAGTYNRQQVLALSDYFDLDVISPIPWTKNLAGIRGEKQSKVHSISIVHPTHFYTPGMFRSIYGRFYRWAIWGTALRLARENRYQAVFASWLFPDCWAAAKVAQELGIPLFVKVHGSDVNCLLPNSRLAELALSVVQQSTKVFCVSRALKNRLIELGAKPEKLEVVYNGLNQETFRAIGRDKARRELGIEHDSPIILYVGNLKKAKGLEELALAFLSLKQQIETSSAKLVVVGKGEYRAELLGILERECGSDHFCLAGEQTPERVALWMNAATLLCLPSHMEGVPNVILEALSCGTPVVATAVGGIPELALEEVGLRLVAPFSVQSLGEGLSATLREEGDVRLPNFIGSWKYNAGLIAKSITG